VITPQGRDISIRFLQIKFPVIHFFSLKIRHLENFRHLEFLHFFPRKDLPEYLRMILKATLRQERAQVEPSDFKSSGVTSLWILSS
jgi:hypothetical protein